MPNKYKHRINNSDYICSLKKYVVAKVRYEKLIVLTKQNKLATAEWQLPAYNIGVLYSGDFKPPILIDTEIDEPIWYFAYAPVKYSSFEREIPKEAVKSSLTALTYPVKTVSTPSESVAVP